MKLPYQHSLVQQMTSHDIVRHSGLCISIRLGCNILVPRPFPLPVFDCLQYANTVGKTWEIWSHDLAQTFNSEHQLTVNIWSHVMISSRQMVDTRGQCPTIIRSSCFVSNVSGVMNDEWYWVYWRCLANALSSSHWNNSTRKGFKIVHWAPSPHMTKSPRPPPSIFAYCKRSNTGSENALERSYWVGIAWDIW